MKPLNTLLAAILTTAGLAGAAVAQAPSQGGYPPSYGNPGQMPYPPGYAGPAGMPPQYMGGGMPPGGEAPQGAAANNKYGWHPIFKGVFTKKSSSDCQGGNCNGGHSGFFGKSKPAPPQPPATGGTLAFPNQPFIRSPRDWFMGE